MFIDKEEEEKKAKELQKNIVAITWDLLVFECIWEKLENSRITFLIYLKISF